MISDNIRQARMQSLLCNHIVPVTDSDLACFAGVTMPHPDLCVFLIWSITNQRSKMKLWWGQGRWQDIQNLNPQLSWPVMPTMGAWVQIVSNVIQHKLVNMRDEDVINLCAIFWPDEHDQPAS